jgi:2-oxoglutarate ferredoxin oxidoreductase subunit alpha
MPAAGEGYNLHITGLTHDEKGYPVMAVETQTEMMARITEKIQRNLDDIIRTDSYLLDDAEIAVVSYGISARTSMAAVAEARKLGIKAGLLRLVTIWPFPEDQIRKLADRVKGFVTVEINLGQIHREVERCAGGKVPIFLVGHPGGTIIHPDSVVNILKEAF